MLSCMPVPRPKTAACPRDQRVEQMRRHHSRIPLPKSVPSLSDLQSVPRSNGENYEKLTLKVQAEVQNQVTCHVSFLIGCEDNL